MAHFLPQRAPGLSRPIEEDILLGVVFEPYDRYLAAQEVISDPAETLNSPLFYAGFLPFVPHATRRIPDGLRATLDFNQTGGNNLKDVLFDARSGNAAPKSADPWLSRQGVRPAPGTRVRPQGVPENWRIRGANTPGGVRYYDPSNPGHSVRVMQGNPNSPFPNSQTPYVRWQYHGQPLDVHGNVLPSKFSPDAHIPLQDFRFRPEVYGQ